MTMGMCSVLHFIIRAFALAPVGRPGSLFLTVCGSVRAIIKFVRLANLLDMQLTGIRNVRSTFVSQRWHNSNIHRRHDRCRYCYCRPVSAAAALLKARLPSSHVWKQRGGAMNERARKPVEAKHRANASMHVSAAAFIIVAA